MACDGRATAPPAPRPGAARGDVGAADADDSTAAAIHLRVPRDVKGRWIARSRAAGQKLGDWIVQQVEVADDDNAARTDATQTGR